MAREFIVAAYDEHRWQVFPLVIQLWQYGGMVHGNSIECVLVLWRCVVCFRKIV